MNELQQLKADGFNVVITHSRDDDYLRIYNMAEDTYVCMIENTLVSSVLISATEAMKWHGKYEQVIWAE